MLGTCNLHQENVSLAVCLCSFPEAASFLEERGAREGEGEGEREKRLSRMKESGAD